MPATERAFTDLPPSRLYLDTNIILDYLVSNRPHHQRAETLILRLATHGHTTIYISSVAWLELLDVVMRPNFRAARPAQWQEDYRLTEWERQPVREHYLDAWLMLVDQMLESFAWEEIAVTANERLQAAQYIAVYNLQAMDALHLACAQAVGVVDLASFDQGFRRVDGLYLWNDRIHAL